MIYREPRCPDQKAADSLSVYAERNIALRCDMRNWKRDRQKSRFALFAHLKNNAADDATGGKVIETRIYRIERAALHVGQLDPALLDHVDEFSEVCSIAHFGAANPIGTVVKIIDNTGSNIVFDRFSGVPEGGLLYQGNTGWRIAYAGGDGNDVTLTAVTVALAPQSVVATPDDRQISLAFTPPADNGTGAITGYSAQCVPGNFTGSAAASSVVVTGLTKGVSYGCTVRAVNAVGAGAESAPVSAVPRGPASAPMQVVASAGVAQFSVSFSAPADNGGSPVSGYQLLCQPGNLAASGAAPPLGFNGLINGQPYACALSAVTAAGAGGAAPFQVTPRTVPNAPTNLTATPYNTMARFDFVAPAFDGGANIMARSTCAR